MGMDRCDHPGTVWRKKQETQGQTEEGWVEKNEASQKIEITVKTKEYPEVVS